MKPHESGSSLVFFIVFWVLGKGKMSPMAFEKFLARLEGQS